MSKLTKTQIKILSYLLNKKERRARFNEMVKELGLARATLSRNLKHLEKNKYVKRVVDSSSREYPPPVYYYITEEGVEALKKAIPFDVDMELIKRGDLVEVKYKMDNITRKALEGMAKASGYDLGDLLKAFTYCLGWGLEYKYKKFGSLEPTEEDEKIFLPIICLLKGGLMRSLKEYWSLEEELDKLEKQIKSDKESYEKFSEVFNRLREQLTKLRSEIKEIIFKSLDEVVEEQEQIQS